MARRGRGFARYIDPTETSHEAAIDLANHLDMPVLTDISVDWGGLRPEGVTPAIIPDLFAGGSLRLMGRFTGSRTGTIIVHGKVNGRSASLPVRVTLSDAPTSTTASTSAIPVIWARAQVADLMRDYTTTPVSLRTLQVSTSELQERVTQLGLDYALVTDWTSFVAVSHRVVNDSPNAARNADVPLPMPAGVQAEAYGETAANFGGSSAPEPGFYALMALLASVLMFALRRKAALASRRI